MNPIKRNAPLNMDVSSVLSVLLFEPVADWHTSATLATPNGIGAADDEYVIALGLGQEAEYIIDGRQMTMKAGDVLFVKRSTARVGRAAEGQDFGCIVINFKLRAVDPDDIAFINHLPNIHRVTDYDMSFLFQELHHTWITKELGYLLNARSLVERIIIHYVRSIYMQQSSQSNAPWLNDAIRIILQNSQHNHSASELAKRYHVSEGYFRSCFKKKTGMSIVQYLCSIRINRAIGYFLYNNFNVTEVARLTGFNNVYYFSRTFKKMTGYSPTGFLKQKQ